jgi:hypothetical protein
MTTLHDLEPIEKAGIIVAQPGTLGLSDRALLAAELNKVQAELRMLRAYAYAPENYEKRWLRAELNERAAWLKRSTVELQS